jgi:hypothetical protein
MRIPTRLQAGMASGIAVVGVAAMAAAPLAPVPPSRSQQTVAQDVRLAAATVPPGGLVTSFLGNQVVYCSIICPLLAETAVTAVVATLQTPSVFLAALNSGDLLKAIGVTAASVTGPTNVAAQKAILADASIPAPRALNAFEVGVVGLLNVIPAAAGGLPGIITAIETAREDTFTALNAPFVPNPAPTVVPHGVVQVAVVEIINVGAAIIFPAFNEFLSGAFEIPDAVAQELAATGDPIRAAAAGVDTAAGVVTAAITVVADSVVTAVDNIRAAAGQAPPAFPTNRTLQTQTSATTTPPAHTTVGLPHPVVTANTKHPNAGPGTSHRLRVASNPPQTDRSVIKKASQRPHRTAPSKSQPVKRSGGGHRNQS